MLAPVASEAETLSLPPDPAQRATEILARPGVRKTRWPTRRLAAISVLVAAALAGLIAAVALSSSGGHASRPEQTSNGVAPPAAGTNVADQARNLAAWLRQHSR